MGRTTKAEVQTLAREHSVSMNRTIAALGVAKSSVLYAHKGYPKNRASSKKAVSKYLFEAIKEICGAKATYGVPRVLAILKRDYSIETTKYMVHRVMKENNWLIRQNRSRSSSREHTGKIEVANPNMRWASDITSIKCWNGEKLRFTYILDCCDRTIISWRAGMHMQACDIEMMIQEAIFKRFGFQFPLPQRLEFLHDNGPEYIEKKLNETLDNWNIESCNTPTYSPQSNGMCEAFNGTFKRDYVYENCLDSAEYVYSMIQGWIDEYNNYAPHSALGMKTPEEFFNYKMAA